MNAKQVVVFAKRHPIPVAIVAALGFYFISKLLVGVVLGIGIAFVIAKKKNLLGGPGNPK